MDSEERKRLIKKWGCVTGPITDELVKENLAQLIEGQTTHSQNLYRHEKAMVRLHELIADGNGDNEEADECRDELEYIHYQLTDTQLEMVEHMSGDLYMLTEREIYFINEYKEKYNKEAVVELYKNGQWVDLLDMIRFSDIGLKRYEIAHYRYIAYEKLGLNLVAEKFHKQYNDLVQKEGPYHNLPTDPITGAPHIGEK